MSGICRSSTMQSTGSSSNTSRKARADGNASGSRFDARNSRTRAFRMDSSSSMTAIIGVAAILVMMTPNRLVTMGLWAYALQSVACAAFGAVRHAAGCTRARSARRVSSATDLTPILCITRARCTLIVFSAVPASRDLFVQMSGDDVPEHLALSRRQRGEPLRHQPVFVLPGARLSVLLDGALDSRDEHVRFEWLLDEIQSAGFEGPHAGLNVALAGQKNDRLVMPRCQETLLKLETADLGQGKIE